MPLAETANLAVMARMQAALWLGGALIATLVALLPQHPEAFQPGYVGAAVVAGTMALALHVLAGRLPPWSLQAIGYLGAVLITACIWFSGEHAGAPATDTEMLYFWVAIHCAYFFGAREVIFQIAFVAALYFVVLAMTAEPAVFAVRWAQTVGTLVVAAVLVQALRNRMGELVHRLTDAARTDPLTGLRNRRAFEETIRAEVERAHRSGHPLSILVGDLDHFKLVNDRFGHPTGDATLIRVGELLTSSRRQVDPVARTGGEEFALVLPNTPEAEAYLVGERLRSAVERAFAGKSIPLTVSFGLASYPRHGTSTDSLLAAADQALYAAKELGRNRTVVFSREIALIAPSRGAKDTPAEGHLATMLSLAEALDLRDAGTSDHSQRVGRYSALIAQEIGLSADRVKRIQIAGILHDVGKIGLPDAILRKRGSLNADEKAQIRRHPEIGAEILSGKDFEDIRCWILAHHERPDGKGYPLGVAAERIPLEARILAVADAYEAMTADRVYRQAVAMESARAELLRCSGTQFDPRVVAAFLAALDRETEQIATPTAA